MPGPPNLALVTPQGLGVDLYDGRWDGMALPAGPRPV